MIENFIFYLVQDTPREKAFKTHDKVFLNQNCLKYTTNTDNISGFHRSILATCLGLMLDWRLISRILSRS